jgi:ankyrin repeat protein
VVELLLEKGADMEYKSNSGQTPLWWAAEKGHEAVVELLLEKGANVESKDILYGRTPLLCAAERGHEAVVKLLLEKGRRGVQGQIS